MSDKAVTTEACVENTSLTHSLAHALHLTSDHCNQAVQAMKPADTTKGTLPELTIDGPIEAAKRQHGHGSINKQEAQMLDEN